MSRASLFDPLIPRPHFNLLAGKPHYEDRILVKRLPFPPDMDPNASTILVTPDIAKRDNIKDYQYGEVVSVADGISHWVLDCDKCGAHRFCPTLRFRHGRDQKVEPGFCPCGAEWSSAEIVKIPCEVRPGDRVLYNRNPDYQFEYEGQLYTFMFEQQYIIGVVE